MIRMRRFLGIVFFVTLVTLLCPSSDGLRNRLQAQNLAQTEAPIPSPKQGSVSQRAPKQPGSASMTDGNSLMEREAALSLKEQEMKKMEQSLDSRIKQLEAARKGLEAPLARKKSEDSLRYKKMLKVYKSLRPEAAAALMDKLDEDMALEMLNQMDQKTAAKLIPYLNQARVLKWTSKSLKEN